MSSLLRSTKFVRYFTGAARTLIINSAKTADGCLLSNSKALSASNSILVKDYATKKKESLEPLLQKLDSEVRRFGRITKRDIDEVFDELRARHDITSSQSLLVIRCCGELVPEELPEKRTLLVQKIWSVLTERGIPMDVSHYNALLRVYIENEHAFSPAKFLEEMEKKGLQPNRVTYQRIMWRYCQEGDVEGATNVLEKMRELNMPVSEHVLNALVMGYGFIGEIDAAKTVMETLTGAGLSTSNRTYALLACGYARKGDIAGVEATITQAKDLDNSLTDKDVLDIIEQLASSGHGDKVEQVFPYLNKSVGYNQEVCNLVLKLLNKNQDETAKALLKTMPKVINSDDTMFKGAFYIKHLLKLNRSDDAILQSCLDLQTEGLIPNAIYIATEACLQTKRTELAQKLFKELKKSGMEIRQHYYWPLLVQKGKEHDEEGLLQIVRVMCNEGFIPTGECLRDYVIPYLKENGSQQNIIVKLQLANVPVAYSARNVMVDLLEHGNIKEATDLALTYRPRGLYSLVARPLLNALSKTKDVEAFVKILHVISSNPQYPQEASSDDIQAEDSVDTNEVGRLVKNAVKIVSKDMSTIESLLSAVLSKGLRISGEIAEDIERYLGDRMTTNISELLGKLTSPDLEIAPLETVRRVEGFRSAAQLENLLEQVMKKDGNNVNSLRKQVITAYIKENNTEKVNSFVEKLKASPDFELNLSTLAQLFEFYCENDEIDKANEISNQITAKDPNFVLSKYKKILMAQAYIRANRFDEAIQYLKENKPTGETEGVNFMLNSKSWQLLSYLAEQKEVEKVKEMTKTLIECEYIDVSNVILGPSIKVHLLNDDIEGALQEFEHCCKQYRSTPWKGELMKALIKKQDATKLQWLADISTQIHGEVNILHDLVLAFVECGYVRQARRILATPGLNTRYKRLYDACEKYVEDGKPECLEAFLEATKDVQNIDRARIYYNLLDTYIKADKTEQALGVWTILQEDNEVPSNEFLIYLANHLKSKNMEIPFIVPESKPETTKPVETKVSQKLHKENAKDLTKSTKESPKSTKEPEKPTKKEISGQIEQLIQDGKTVEAANFALKQLEEGVKPTPNVFKYLLKNLALEANVDKIKSFEKHLTPSMKRNVTFDDKLTLAIFNQGSGTEHLEELCKFLEKASSKEEIELAITKYPRSTALASAIQDPQNDEKCLKAAELAASNGYTLLTNLLWIEYLLAGRNEDANKLWQKYLINCKTVMFRRLLQESHSKREPQIVEKMIEILKTNKTLPSSVIGNAYSRLINFYIAENNINEANATLKKAFESGVTTEYINKSTLDRLKEASDGKIQY